MNSNEKQKDNRLNKAVCTWIILIANLLIYFMCEDATYYLGVSYQSVIINEEMYRLFTALFYHMDFWHIALNMIALYIFGKEVEERIGSVKFIVIYMLAGIGSDVVSIYSNYYFRPEYDVYSVGASGAIFGLITASSILDAKEKGEKLIISVFASIVGAIIYTFITWRAGVDIFGHLGGVIVGGIVTGFLALRYKEPKKEKAFFKVLAIITVLFFSLSVIAMMPEGAMIPDESVEEVIEESTKGYDSIEEVTKKTTYAPESNNIVDSAKRLGQDIILDASKSSEYKGNYYKIEGVVEQIDNTTYLVRYLSTMNSNKNMYYAWILGKDDMNLHVGDGVEIVGKYVGFAEESVAPTLEEYKVDTITDPIKQTLWNQSKVVNYDISFDDLLRTPKYQDYVCVEGIITNVFDESYNIEDVYGNYYCITEKRLNPSTVIPGDYVTIFGVFEGTQKEGYVWPVISWLQE